MDDFTEYWICDDCNFSSGLYEKVKIHEEETGHRTFEVQLEGVNRDAC